jgi:hypothetical protein
VYCGTLTAAYNILYEKFTYIGEVLLFITEDNTEGKKQLKIKNVELRI